VIGKGGMATVCRAHQPSMNRDVAIKIIAPDLASDPEFLARFEREAKIVANLQHPHILPVYDFGHDNGMTYLVMRLMLGGSLAQELHGGPIPVERVIELTRQIGSALDYAHLRGIVHRDLKPTNILLDETGNACLTDFGIAKMISGGPTTGLTATGQVMGTPTYMAPEQWRAEPVDARTDVYAFGVILYQMLLGQVPFAAETPHGLMYQHLDKRPPAPRSIKPDLPAGIEPVITKALAKHREDRYASAGELAHDLERALLAPRRLPEQTDLEARQVGTYVTEIDTSDQGAYDAIIEDELLAQAPIEENPDLQPTVPPPTAPHPPRYAPPPAGPTFQAPPVYSPPPAYPPPVQQAPLYAPQPDHVPTPYPYEAPGAALNRWLWVLGVGIAGIVVLVVAVVLVIGVLSSGGDNNTSGPTLPPPPAASATPAVRPTVAVTAPANGTQIDLGDAVTIQFTASDARGVTRVELRRFDVVLTAISGNNQATFQGSFDYTPDSTGAHTLEVVPWSGDIRGDPAAITIYAR
jgi:serine/threonine-protein kinase